MKIIPIFFYHEKWAVIMRKFVYSPDGGREDGSPSWGRKPLFVCIRRLSLGREDGSPSWGRKQSNCIHIFHLFTVEKMGPLRGDGSHLQLHICHIQY